MKFKKRNKNVHIPNSIGIIGSKSGCGVTHIALMLANFLASALRYPVNYVEVCRKSQIYNLVCDNACQKGDEVCYSYKGVDYFPNATIALAKRLLLDKSSITVIDCGVQSQELYMLLDKCERVLLVGSVMPWCIEDLKLLVQNTVSNYVDIHKTKICVRNCKTVGRSSFLLEHKLALFHVPEGVDPFAIRQSDFETIERLL